MVKTYTITFQRANNYGAMLQTYALQKFLQKRYESQVIDYDNHAIFDDYKVIRPINKNPLKTSYHLVKDLYDYNISKKRFERFEKFRENIDFTSKVDDVNKIDNLIQDNAVLICGSDQIWNPIITRGFNRGYFLEFGKSCKRISYAASCGSIDVLNDNYEIFLKKLKKFHKISVREESLQEKIEKDIKFEIPVVIDPTILLKKEEWLQLNIGSRIVNEKYIFAYSVGNDNEIYYQTLNNLFEKTGYKIIYFEKRDIHNKIKGIKESFYSSGPIEFLNLLYYSEMVVTTSFHGLAMSAIFNKKVLITLSSHPDRLKTLIKKIGLQQNVVRKTADIDIILHSTINWQKVNKKLEEERKKSSEWLINAIEK